MIKISSNPQGESGNARFVELTQLIINPARVSVGTESAIYFWYACYTHRDESLGENGLPASPEAVLLRKPSCLTATNEIKVNEQGTITEDGTIGEADFYLSAIFSGNFTREQLIEMVILRADARGQFD
jgi:hypothetical protein